MDRANSSLISNYWLSCMQKDSKKPVLLTLRFYKRVEIASCSAALIRLRDVCPNITKNEELLCMLILLNQSTEEIARILGIASASVTRIRYRLRPKLNIPEKASLDAEIKRIMKE